VVDLATAKHSDTGRYGCFFHGMLGRGVFLAASQFEAAFVSLAHTEEDLDSAVGAAAETLKTLG
jgi:glutamate-1-semialdehyde 2,1-aminomutase